MNFGMIPYDGLSKEAFILPEVKENLLPGKAYPEPRLYIGLSKWNDPAWKGKLYPTKTKDADTLPFYAGQFNALEFNGSHYHIPAEIQVKKWYDKTDGHAFQFCPKFPQLISHRGKIDPVSKAGVTDQFLKSIAAFEDKLGAGFLQVSDSYSYKNKEELLNYFKSLPRDIDLFAETRHPSWFENVAIMDEFARELAAINKGWVMTDTPGRRDILHMRLPNRKAFIRFVCQGNNEIDRFRIHAWKQQLSAWYANGLETCWFFLHIHDEEGTIDFAKEIQTVFSDIIQ